MSTTGGTPMGTVLIADPPDVIRKKFKSRRHRLRPRRAARAGQARRHEPDRDHVGRRRRAARGDRGPLRRPGLRAVQVGRRPRRSSRSSSRCGCATRSSRADPGELERLLAVGAEKARGRGRADARGDVRAHGVRPALSTEAALIAATVVATALTGVLHYATDEHVLDLRRRRGRAGRARLARRARHRVARLALRARRDRCPAVDAREPSRALHRPLRALGRRDRRGADLDPRLAVRERAARPRRRHRRGRDRGRRTAACASARGCRTTRPSCCCWRPSRSSCSGSRTASATAPATISWRSR